MVVVSLSLLVSKPILLIFSKEGVFGLFFRGRRGGGGRGREEEVFGIVFFRGRREKGVDGVLLYILEMGAEWFGEYRPYLWTFLFTFFFLLFFFFSFLFLFFIIFFFSSRLCVVFLSFENNLGINNKQLLPFIHLTPNPQKQFPGNKKTKQNKTKQNKNPHRKKKNSSHILGFFS